MHIFIRHLPLCSDQGEQCLISLSNVVTNFNSLITCIIYTLLFLAYLHLRVKLSSQSKGYFHILGCVLKIVIYVCQRLCISAVRLYISGCVSKIGFCVKSCICACMSQIRVRSKDLCQKCSCVPKVMPQSCADQVCASNVCNKNVTCQRLCIRHAVIKCNGALCESACFKRFSIHLILLGKYLMTIMYLV